MCENYDDHYSVMCRLPNSQLVDGSGFRIFPAVFFFVKSWSRHGPTVHSSTPQKTAFHTLLLYHAYVSESLIIESVAGQGYAERLKNNTGISNIVLAI